MEFWPSEREQKSIVAVWLLLLTLFVCRKLYNLSFASLQLAEYRGTQVAVKRVIPPKKPKKGGAEADEFSGHTSGMASGVGYGRKSTGSMSGENENNDEDLSERSNPRESLSSFDAGKMSGVRSMVASNGRASVVNQSETTSRKKMKKEFIEEMRHLAKLRHPNITTVMGAVTKGDPMLIMEYMGEFGIAGNPDTFCFCETCPF